VVTRAKENGFDLFCVHNTAKAGGFYQRVFEALKQEKRLRDVRIEQEIPTN